MNKNWFIFKGSHHQGPFSKKDLQNMVFQEKISASDLVWKEGMNDWRPIASIDDLSENQEANLEEFESEESVQKEIRTIPEKIPPLPKIPEEKEDCNSSIVVHFENEVKGEDYRRELSEISREEFQKTQNYSLKEFEESQKSEEARPSKNYLLYVSSGLTFIIVIFLLFVFGKEDSFRVSLVGLSQNSARDYRDVLSKMDRKKQIHVLHVGDRGRKMWFAINRSIDGRVKLSITSKDNRVISQSRITFTTHGNIRNGQGVLHRLNFVKGVRFALGEYQFSGVIQTTGYKKSLVEIGESISILNPIINFFYPGLKKSFDVNGTIRFYGKNKTDFLDKLELFKKSIKDKQIIPLEARMQSLKTLRLLLINLKALYIDNLESAKGRRSWSNFERVYGKSIFPPLKDILYSSKRMIKEYEKVNFVDAKAYEEILSAATSLGEFAAGKLKAAKKYKRYNKKIKNRLEVLFDKDYRPLLEKIDALINKTNLQMNSI